MEKGEKWRRERRGHQRGKNLLKELWPTSCIGEGSGVELATKVSNGVAYKGNKMYHINISSILASPPPTTQALISPKDVLTLAEIEHSCGSTLTNQPNTYLYNL